MGVARILQGFWGGKKKNPHVFHVVAAAARRADPITRVMSKRVKRQSSSMLKACVLPKSQQGGSRFAVRVLMCPNYIALVFTEVEKVFIFCTEVKVQLLVQIRTNLW